MPDYTYGWDHNSDQEVLEKYYGGDCKFGPHRPPEGPCEDISQCPFCLSPSFSMRPPGECFGHHAPDCSLPERHESYCKGGGFGHKTEVLRGYPEFTWESQ